MNIQDLITKHEGCKVNPYNDIMGIPTIGIGHNMQAHPLPDGMIPPLTQEQITQLFREDLQVVINNLTKNLSWFVKLDEVRQAVLIDMSFNMGWSTLSKFHNTLKLIQEGNYAGAANEMLNSAWAKQVPSRAAEDSNMMASGLWPDEPIAS
jgi:lysozyme